MMLTVLLLYMFLITDSETINYEQFVLETYKQKCPYSDTCAHESTLEIPKTMDGYIPCCFPCSCKENCSETKSCCPDAFNSSVVDDDGDKDTECLTSGYPVIDQYHNGANSNLKRYKTIRTCPSTYPHEKTVLQCTRLSPRTLDELIFVSDEDGKIYRNRYCALCNNVLKFTRWNLIINCKEIRRDTFSKNIKPIDIKKSQCIVWSEAPQHFRLSPKSSCYLVDYDKCNMTGLWSKYDTNIDNACRRGQFGLFRFKEMLYQNIFCYICNPYFKDSRIFDECRSLNPKLIKNSFTAIFNTEILSGEFDSSTICKVHEIYDNYADKCRPLICPVNSFPKYGTCMRLFKATYGLVVEIDLRLTSREYFPNSSYDVYDIFKAASVAINDIIESQDENCRVCTNTVSTTSATEYVTLFVELEMATSSSCLESNILDIANKMDNSAIVLNVTDSQKLTFSIHLILQQYEPGMYYHMYFFHECNDPNVHIYDLLCPRILISGTDYVKARKANRLIQTDHYLEFQLNKENQNLSNITFEICVDQYYVSSGSRNLRLTYYSTTNMEVNIMTLTFYSLLGVLLRI